MFWEHFDLNLFPQRITISLRDLKHSHLSLNQLGRPLSDL